MLDGQRAIAEAELLLLQLARSKAGPCRVCAGRSRQVVIWDGEPSADANPCPACGWTPFVTEVLYDSPPPLLWTP